MPSSQSSSQSSSQPSCKVPSFRIHLFKPIRNPKGQGLVEYIVIVALVAVAAIGVVRVLGQAVNSRFAAISYALQGRKEAPSVQNLDKADLSKKDLGNFNNGVEDRSRGENE